MWTLVVLSIIILSIVVIYAEDSGASLFAIVFTITAFTFITWAVLTDAVYFSPDYRVGHEIVYGDKWGTIDSIYYKVGDTLLLQKNIDFK